MFVSFMGVVAGPPLFSGLHAVLRSYAWSYALLVVFALVAAALIRAARSHARHGVILRCEPDEVG